MTKKKSNKGGKQKAPEMPGADYGIDRPSAVMTAPDFNDNLRAADVIACAYGDVLNEQVGSVIPFVSLVAKKPELLTKAFVQFKAWMDATGPDALNVEILYSALGYYISFAPDYQHAMWRTVGVDRLATPIYWGITYIKTIDTRQAFLDDLAMHAKHPIAPVILGGMHYTGDGMPRPGGPRPNDLKPIAGCPDLLLLHLPVYKTPEEVPRFSGLVSVVNAGNESLRDTPEDLDTQTKSAASVWRARERRLLALMPVTMHMLRTSEPLQAKLDAFAADGIARWQLEQALINQRLWSLASSSQRARFQNANDRYKAIESFVELDSPNWASIADDRESIVQQVLRDSRVLLKRLGAMAPATLPECEEELKKLGYLTDPGTAV
ncbi:hypothetical protein [Bradyrhizobium sp. S69]|uniref:hypothetical protein n=1 Tax=Bradyrhizobium sp. S69 TaxID=1641856 RepID=UPI00131C4682|nr:hypothetical protein [Bradyrhizobium sp. S69]